MDQKLKNSNQHCSVLSHIIVNIQVFTLSSTSKNSKFVEEIGFAEGMAKVAPG